MYPSVDHIVECYDDVKLAAVDAIMNKVVDHRFQVLAVSDWDGNIIKTLLRIGDTGCEYVVTFTKTVNGLVPSISKNYRYKYWPGVELDDLGLGLPKRSRAAIDPGREIWEHSFRNHKKLTGKEPPKWVHQPDHVKKIIRDRYRIGSTVHEVNGSVYKVRANKTWYHYMAFTTKHERAEQIMVRNQLSLILSQTHQHYPDYDQWLRIRKDMIEEFKTENNC